MSPSCASSIAMYTSRDDDTRDPLTILSGPAGTILYSICTDVNQLQVMCMQGI